MKRRALAAAIAVCASAGASGWQSAQGVFAKLDPVVDAIWSGFDTAEAQRHVEFISQYWRLAGNAGYNASLDRIQSRLASGKLTRLFFDEYPNTDNGGWDYTIGTLAIAGGGALDEVVLSREKERLALCINSFSTPPEGVVAPLYDVGRGERDEDYAGKNLKGAVVLGDADVGQLWRRAVVTGGAIGVVSTSLPRYISPDPPGAPPTPRDQWDILQWSSIPYDAPRKGFGFKATPRAAARLRAALARTRVVGADGMQRPSDHVMVRVTISSSFSEKPARARLGATDNLSPNVIVGVTVSGSFTSNPVRTLVAEIPGAVAPAERVILAAHVQEPGANDNASGVATLAELAVALQSGIRAGRIPPPARTLTFLFLNEISGSRRWLQDHAADAKGVRYMISMDMTGEDVTKTGGTFLVERWPDPGAVWDRPWDPHTEWGRGNVRADQLKGDLINDTHLAVCDRVARKTGWVVKSNPYEGGSDHTVFGGAGIPAILDWHFTDRYYHTNFDTPDKTSPAEMRNVGVCAASTAWLLASSDASMSLLVAELVADAGKARVAVEEREGAKIAAADKDPAAAKAREGQIVAAWRKWYAEAVRSVSRLVVGSPPADFTAGLDTLAAEFERVPSADWSLSPRTRSADWSLAPRTSEFIRIIPASLQAVSGRTDTPLFVCGTDMVVPPIPLRWEAVVLAGDSQGFTPCPGPHAASHREVREADVLRKASRDPDAEFRRFAVQAMGHMGSAEPFEMPRSGSFVPEQSVDVPALGTASSELLNDREPRVRREAVNAIGDLLSGTARELLPFQRKPAGSEEIAKGRSMLEARFKLERDDDVAGTILETIGRLKYPDDSARDEVEAWLGSNVSGSSARVLGAAKGLEGLIRGNPKRTVGLPARERLRELASSGPRVETVLTSGGRDRSTASESVERLARARRLAMLALQQARDDDIETVIRAAGDADWQVRRLAALRLDLARDEFKPIIEPLFGDPVFQVRYETLGAIARYATRTKDCSLFPEIFDDPETTVVLRAIDTVPVVCAADDEIVRRLVAWSEELRSSLGPRIWHKPAHAYEALARLRPDTAAPLLDVALDHQIWQVRARAAAATVAIKNEEAAKRLADDAEPNVRTAALAALVALKSRSVFQAAIRALESRDHQLIRSAVSALRSTPDAERVDAVNALLTTLGRLTDGAWDTSRDPRVAILERLGELLPVERSADLGPFREDFDAKVRAGADAALAKITGTTLPPPMAIKRRYPYQPSLNDLSNLPSSALIKLEDGGEIRLEMLVDQAPVTVARFAELAKAHYYNGLTFHRVVPNYVIQGGSPGANEYAGASRYMRDEAGTEPHIRGAVGISTRGRDTGDAQIFIDLVDNPRLDHEYTVFARLVSGLDVVDRVLEGARMTSVTVK